MGVELRPSAAGQGKDIRKGKRSRALFKATISVRGRENEARIRDFSSLGVLVEMDQPPVLGTKVFFCRGKLSAAARVAWVGGNRAGLAFDNPVNEKALLAHVPGKEPKPAERALGKGSLPPGRPGVTRMTAEELRLARVWARQMGMTFDG